LLVAELVGCQALNEALPGLANGLDVVGFAALKRPLIAEMAQWTAVLHRSHLFHKDLYLCHFFIDLSDEARPGRQLSMIDFHRLGRHRWTAFRWRVKDLAQLLYSTYAVAEIDDRDRLRFWIRYRRALGLGSSKWLLHMIRLKAGRYRRHNRSFQRSALSGRLSALSFQLSAISRRIRPKPSPRVPAESSGQSHSCRSMADS
jgi:heptose I phosphotransferase